MKKILRYALYAIGALLLLGLLAAGGTLWRVNQRLSKPYSVTVEKLAVPADSASLALGHARSRMCTGCHGADLGGRLMFTDPQLGDIHSPNLTRGNGGIGGAYGTDDWVRAIRHGIRKNGEALFVMPSREYAHFTREELAAVIAYVNSVPPVDRQSTGVQITPMAKILVALGAFGDVINAETIDHRAALTDRIPASASPDYGSHLVEILGCKTCHGTELNGGKDPNPKAPMGPNLTPGGALAQWGLQGFKQTLRTGRTPLGRALLSEFMPWEQLKDLSDTELEAIYAFLMAQPKRETAVLK